MRVYKIQLIHCIAVLEGCSCVCVCMCVCVSVCKIQLIHPTAVVKGVCWWGGRGAWVFGWEWGCVYVSVIQSDILALCLPLHYNNIYDYPFCDLIIMISIMLAT